MVYSILHENDLCNYYQLDTKPGISLRNEPGRHYDYLDDLTTRNRIIDFSDGSMCRVHFVLPQIHCSACIWLLENLSRLDKGIISSRINFLRKEIHLSFNEKDTTLRKIVELLSAIGYAPVLNLDKLDGDKTAIDRSLYYKLGLAGFTFGNIMLLSFPEYLGLDPIIDGPFANFFRYLNLMLIIPVVIYSGQDYFRSAWRGLKQGNLNIDVPVSIGILALFGRSSFEILSQLGPGYLDSLAGLIFFLLVGKWYQQKTYDRLSFDRGYKSYFPISISKLSQEGEKMVTIDKLLPGDHIRVRHAELVPVDGILIKGHGKIDYSYVTGESKPVPKKEGDQIFAGGRQMGAAIQICTTKKAADGYLTQLWKEAIFADGTSTGQVSTLANRVATFFTWVILIVASITFIYWSSRDLAVAFQSLTAVLIVACPCAVALSIPFIFGNVIRLLQHHKIFIKNTNVIENISEITDVVFDKTGTITHVQDAEISYKGTSLSPREKRRVVSLVKQSTHPVSFMIANHLGGLNGLEVHHFEEVIGQGISGTIEGHEIAVGSERFVQKRSGAAQPSGQGVCVQINGTVVGNFIKKDPFRPNLINIIRKLSSRYQLSLLTGDDDHQRKDLAKIFSPRDILRFNQSPKEKWQYIKTLQEQNRKAVMIGDGLNDAGALKQSNVGVVISENTNHFTPASDVIMEAGQFGRLPNFLALCRHSVLLVYVAYLLALIYNIIGLSFAVQGALSPVIAAILMPASSLTVVLFGMLSSAWLTRWHQF